MDTNVVSPSGELGSVPQEQLQEALQQGYKVATPGDVDAFQNEQKYGTTTEMAKTFGEGAANAATFGLFRAAERAANVSPRGVIGREETNPITYGAGEAAGLLGTSALGIGEGAVLDTAGSAAARAVGLAEHGIVNKVGTAAVKGAVENSLFQAGDEVAKMAISDPNQSVGTAAANVGISGLLGVSIGGGLGVVSPLWEATTGGRLGNFLELLKNKADGKVLPMEASVQNAIDHAVESGFEISPELKASMSSDPELRNFHAQLLDSSTKPGVDMKEAVDNFQKKVQEHVLTQLGKSPEYLNQIADKSEFQLAKKVSDGIIDRLDEMTKPAIDGFEGVSEKAGEAPLINKGQLEEKIGEWAMRGDWVNRKGTPGHELYQMIQERLPATRTVQQAKNLATDIWSKAKQIGDGWGEAGQLVKMVRDMEADSVVSHLGATGGQEAVANLKAARGLWSQTMDTIDSLNSRLKVGKYRNLSGFMEKLSEKFGERPETILSRLNPKDDAGLIDLLQKDFPEINNRLREYHQDEALWRASKGAQEGTVKTKKLFDNIKEMSPEMRNWLYTPDQQKLFSALDTMSKQLNGITHNFSGTAKAADVMKKHAITGAMAAASMLMGHGAAAGAILGEASRYLSRDLPDAVKLGLLKYLGSNAETNPKGFAAMVSYLTAVYKGEAKTSQAVKNLFRAGKIVIPSKLLDDHTVEKIDKRLKSLLDDQEQLMNSGTDMAHYMPDHGAAVAQSSMSAVNYLNSLKPKPVKNGFMDSEIKPGPVEKAAYKRALSLAENPLQILNDVKDGSITMQDLKHLNSLYPGLYKNIQQKISNELTENTDVPYKTRIGLSIFMATPLDSTMTPQFILSHQIAQQQAPQQQSAQRPKHSMVGIAKIPSQVMTSDQSRLARHNKV